MWDLFKWDWETRHKTRKSIGEIQEFYNWHPFYTLEYFELEAKRLIEYTKIEGNKYKIIRVEELIEAISDLKQTKLKQWERRKRDRKKNKINLS
tara:strand:- start:191 stop:472 length:282 start_codon:yes stop_codon:yes gene_type:complete